MRLITNRRQSIIETILICGFLTVFLPRIQGAQEGILTRYQDKFPAVIPVHITGYTAEAARILKQDLLFMGFEDVPESEARFLIRGQDPAGRVEARVVEKVNNNQVLGKAFTGRNKRALIHALADAINEAITPYPGIAQTKITFRTHLTTRRTEVYIADYDGFNAQPVTQDGVFTAAPCWAGRDMLYYSSYKLGTPKIYFHQLSTGKRQSITPYAGSNISPAVSPNGKKVAMILSKGGSPDLYVADLNGGRLQRLTTTRADESSPCWSPDSQTILFVSRTSGAARLYKIPVTGGRMQPVTTRLVGSATEPDWSPDGKWIVFTTMTREFQVCLVSAEGGDAEVLAAGEDPSWAPNSRAIIYCRGRDRGKKLYLLDVPTKQVKDIARISMSNSQPNWAK